jgi:hypothetical protein
MALHKVGQADEARKTLERLNQVMSQPFVNGRRVAESYQREAAAVLSGK